MLAKLTTVFRDVFEDDEIEITPQTTAKDILDWDSLRHVTLMLSTEKAFGVRFRSAEVANLKNVGELMDLIARKSGTGA